MTITNHVRYIETHIDLVILYVDDREYGRAHIVLDDIEKRIKLARDHIDKLQLNADCAARPAGGD